MRKLSDHVSNTSVVKRASGFAIAIILIFAMLAGRILIIQTVNYDKYQDKVLGQLTTEVTVKSDRGKIYDRNGIALATNVTVYRVFIEPKTIAAESKKSGIDYADIIARGVSEILTNITYESIIKQTEYVNYLDRTIARNVMEDKAKAIEKLIDKHGLEHMLYLQAGSMRYYPYSTLASHVIGFTGSDGKGLYGLEYYYNDALAGTDGRYITARDTKGNEMPYEFESYIAAIDGSDIYLTLDINIQATLEEQLKTTYLESGGQNRATGIVTDVKTGGILAMATYPSFDLNNPRELDFQSKEKLDKAGLTEGSEEYAKLKQELMLEMWSNKAVTEVYMPGSTFKMITASMAYEENVVDDNHRFNCPGYHYVSGVKIRCHKLTGHGSLNFREGIQQSCNPVLMMMGEKIGRDNFRKYFEAFGYMEKTGIDLPGEGQSIFFTDENFKQLELATSSFGQNFKISPIQQMMAVTAVANDGKLTTPHLLSKITDQNGKTIRSFETEVRRQVVSSATAKIVSDILEEGVATNGGSKNAYVPGYKVAAKTGTSEKIDKQNAEGGKDFYICSAVAYAPADAPEISAMIMVDEPTRGVLYASVIAAPYIAKLLETTLPYLGVEVEYTEKELEEMATKTLDIRFWKRGEALDSYAKSLGFEIEFVGDGDTVLSQYPEPGTRLEKKGAKIIAYTERNSEPLTVKVPDLVGKTALAANQMLLNYGLNIKIEGTKNYLSGSGVKVVSQSHAPGTEVERGTVITVTFMDLEDDDRTFS